MKQNLLWSRTGKHFGEVRPGDELVWTFYYQGKSSFLSVNAACGCITSNWDHKTNSFTATMKVDKNFPSWLKTQNPPALHQELYKTITVQMRNEPPVTMSLRGVLIAPEIAIELDQEAKVQEIRRLNNGSNNQKNQA